MKRYRNVQDVYQKELHLLRKFSDYKYTPLHVFTGCTELVTAALDDVVAAYDEIAPSDGIEIADITSIPNMGDVGIRL